VGLPPQARVAAVSSRLAVIWPRWCGWLRWACRGWGSSWSFCSAGH